MKLLSIIIPAFNEDRTIATLLQRVLAVSLADLGIEKEIIVVNDCSTDDTVARVSQFAHLDCLKMISHQTNRGKGAALRTGIQAATGDIVIIQDADLEYNPSEYGKLIRLIVEDRADVVFGSRFAGGEPHRVLYFWHYVGNTFLTLLSNMLTDINLTDMETCYKVFRRDVLRQFTIEENRFGFEPEITAKVAKLARAGQCRIYEVGISYSGRTYAEGKKIGWKDAVAALRCILKYNLLR